MNTLPLFPQDDNPILKKCYICSQSFPATLEFFYNSKNTKDGLYRKCRACSKAYNEALKEYRKQRYQENKDEISGKQKQSYELRKDELNERRRNNDKEKNREYAREYRKRDEWKQYAKEYRSHAYQERKDEILESRKQYHQDNKEEINAQRRQHRKDHPEIYQGIDRAHKHKRKAQKLAVGGSYTAQELQEQLVRQKHKCYYCKAKLGKGKGAWHADHIVPLSRGGTNDISNIVIACPTCNMRKNDKLPHEWIDGGRLL